MDRFSSAIEAFDEYHQKDPNTELFNGVNFPKELLYATRMTTLLDAFAPNASEAVKLAARCQHIGRWEIPREKYPMDRKGYLQWRNEAKSHHARIAEEILRSCGYDQDLVDQVKGLILKKGLFTNPETQLLEDVACLVFLEHYASEFADKHDDEKVVDILRKTMKKMSERAIKAVGSLPLTDHLKELVARAAGGS
jgi:hypothetical protein